LPAPTANRALDILKVSMRCRSHSRCGQGHPIAWGGEISGRLIHVIKNPVASRFYARGTPMASWHSLQTRRSCIPTPDYRQSALLCLGRMRNISHQEPAPLVARLARRNPVVPNRKRTGCISARFGSRAARTTRPDGDYDLFLVVCQVSSRRVPGRSRPAISAMAANPVTPSSLRSGFTYAKRHHDLAWPRALHTRCAGSERQRRAAQPCNQQTQSSNAHGLARV